MREERLAELPIEWAHEACACVVMASGGYPAAYRKGLEIRGLNADGQREDATVYHAGTSLKEGRFFTNGGRVLGVTAMAATLDEALDKAYACLLYTSQGEAAHRLHRGGGGGSHEPDPGGVFPGDHVASEADRRPGSGGFPAAVHGKNRRRRGGVRFRKLRIGQRGSLSLIHILNRFNNHFTIA